MNEKKIRNRAIFLFSVLGIAFSSVNAKTFPEHPVKLVVPFTVGGTMDMPSRILADALSKESGQTFIVENRPGAGGVLGSSQVARANNDGYTILVTSSALPISQALGNDVNFDSVKSYDHIGIWAELPTIIAINSERLNVKNLSDIISLAKENPGKLTFGTPGNGTTSHLAAEILKENLGLDIMHVPYRGAAQAVTAAMGKEIDLIFVGQSSVAPQIQSGRLSAVAVTTASRSPQLQNVPAVSEYVEGFDVPTWLGIAVPAGTPEPVLTNITLLMQKVMADSEVQRKLKDAAVMPVLKSADVTTEQVDRELAVYTDLVKKLGIKSE